jgi:Fic family protein
MKNFQSGRYIQQGHYKSFQPDLINRKWSVENMELIQLLGRADRELGRLDMYSEYIPNIDLFISMHVLKEATQSSKIEGTQTDIAEALLDEEDVAPEKRDDWEEIQNYVAAMKEAITKLQTLPFSARLIRETHCILLQGVRGKHKQPGDFRQSQNWIGGATLSDAIFIPPVHNSIGELMSDIEMFVHNNTDYFPELLKIALVHYQFETIHPFLDGNSRVGRLLIPLYLVVGGAYPTDNRGILKQPVLYLSDFFERNRTNYYDNLMRVREKNDLVQWFKFFLVGIIETASSSVATFDNILKLQKQVEGQIQTLGSRTVNAQKVINYLYQRPIIDAAKVTEVVAVSPTSAYKLIVDLVQLGILEEITGGKRGKQYMFTAYLNLFK